MKLIKPVAVVELSKEHATMLIFFYYITSQVFEPQVFCRAPFKNESLEGCQS